MNKIREIFNKIPQRVKIVFIGIALAALFVTLVINGTDPHFNE